MHNLRRISSTSPHELPRKLLHWVGREVGNLVEEWRAHAGAFEVKPAELPLLVVRHPPTPAEAAYKVLEGAAKHFAPADHVVVEAQARFPGEVESLLAEANDLCQGEFRMLGESVDYSSGIRWHFDPRHKHEFESGVFHSRIAHSDPEGGYDIKYPWELSRLQHLPRLALAFRLTGDARYRDALIDHTRDWLHQNPTGFGPNWACTMDVGIRAANLGLAHAFLASPGEGAFKPSLWGADLAAELVCNLVAHGRFIGTHLEWSEELTSNHYLADIAGLAVLACLLSPSVPEARNWLRFARDELAQEIKKQVYSDGWDFEASTAYHRLALECFLIPAILHERSDEPMGQEYKERLRSMAGFVRDITLPSGAFPLIGDNDSGRFLVLQPRPAENLNYILALSAAFLDNAALKPARLMPAPEIPWLLGEESYRRFKALENRDRPIAASYPDGGVWCLRSLDGLDLLTFRLGPVGQGGNGGHAHNDQLSVTIWFNGQPVVVDPGTACYTPDPKKRDLFRSTRYHATVVLGEEEQNRFVPGNLFSLPQDVQTSPVRIVTTEEGTSLDGTLRGYGSWSVEDVRITRKIQHSLGRREFEIEDEVELSDHLANIPIAWHFPLAPGLTVGKAGPGQCRIRSSEGDTVADVLFYPGWRLEEIETTSAPAYGEETPNFTLRFVPPPETYRSKFIFRAALAPR